MISVCTSKNAMILIPNLYSKLTLQNMYSLQQNEWNFKHLQNTWCIQKISRLKLCTIIDVVPLHTKCMVVSSHLRAHPKMGLAIFVSLYISLAGVQLLSLLCHLFKPTNFQTWIIPLLSSGVGGRNISISSGFTPAQKIWDLQWVLWLDSLEASWSFL